MPSTRYIASKLLVTLESTGLSYEMKARNVLHFIKLFPTIVKAKIAWRPLVALERCLAYHNFLTIGQPEFYILHSEVKWF